MRAGARLVGGGGLLSQLQHVPQAGSAAAAAAAGALAADPKLTAGTAPTAAPPPSAPADRPVATAGRDGGLLLPPPHRRGVSSASTPHARSVPGLLAYEEIIVRGALDTGVTPDRTACFVHGLLGSGRNWRSFARRLAEASAEASGR